MGELSFLTIIVSLAVCSILVFAVYQYMKVRFTVLEHSQKEQALILQQYIEESSYDIQGLQSVVFRQQQAHHQAQQHHHQGQSGSSEPEEVYEDHNKHIHMDTVMYEAPNKPRSTLIAISSDSENTTSDEDEDGESDGSSSDGSSSDGSDSDGSSSDGSDGSDGSSDGSEDSEIECENVHVVHHIHEVKHIEISITADVNDNELEVESVTIIDEEPASAPEPAPALAPAHEEPALETKTITLDLGTNVDTISQDEHNLATMTEASESASASSVSFHGLSVIELRALLKEKYKGHHDKITNLQKLKKPELIQLLQE